MSPFDQPMQSAKPFAASEHGCCGSWAIVCGQAGRQGERVRVGVRTGERIGLLCWGASRAAGLAGRVLATGFNRAETRGLAGGRRHRSSATHPCCLGGCLGLGVARPQHCVDRAVGQRAAGAQRHPLGHHAAQARHHAAALLRHRRGRRACREEEGGEVSVSAPSLQAPTDNSAAQQRRQQRQAAAGIQEVLEAACQRSPPMSARPVAHPGAAWGAAGTAGWAGGPGCAAGAPRGGRRAEGLQQRAGEGASIAVGGSSRGLEAAARARVLSTHLSGSWSVPSLRNGATGYRVKGRTALKRRGGPQEAVITGRKLLASGAAKPQRLGASPCAA